MRTVHETEALRPSDPIPKSMQPAKTSRRLKLNLKALQSQHEEPHPEEPNGVTNGDTTSEWTSSYPPELGFTPEEEAQGPDELWRYLRRQLVWVEEDSEILKRQCDEMEQVRQKEWAEKEVLLNQVIQNEIGYHERRAEVLAGEMIPTAEEIRAAAAVAGMGSVIPQSPSPLLGQPIEDRTEAAAVLASLSQA